MKEVDVLFTVFISLYFVFMVPMGGSAEFGDVNFTEDDLTAAPDIETPDRYTYDLEEDAVETENVKFYNLSEVDGEVGFGASTDDYDINRVVGRNESGGVSYAVYELDNWEELRVLSTQRALESNALAFQFDDPDDTEETSYGANTLEVPDDADSVNVSFTDETDNYLYFMEGLSGQTFEGVTGFLELVVLWFGSIFNYILTLVSVAASLPFYLNIPFGIYFAYLIMRIISFL